MTRRHMRVRVGSSVLEGLRRQVPTNSTLPGLNYTRPPTNTGSQNFILLRACVLCAHCPKRTGWCLPQMSNGADICQQASCGAPRSQSRPVCLQCKGACGVDVSPMISLLQLFLAKQACRWNQYHLADIPCVGVGAQETGQGGGL
eukprot:1161274-Pelagomonas_calceolata.AAC.4